MPLLDSFTVDHTKFSSPAVRFAKLMRTPAGDQISVFDIRWTQPNKELLSEKGIHTLEHLFAGFMREELNSDTCEIIDLSPMGCRTGFYMSLIGRPTEEEVRKAWANSMNKVLAVETEEDIPELNEYQCGTYTMHSLADAHASAQKVLDDGIKIMNNDDLTLSSDSGLI